MDRTRTVVGRRNSIATLAGVAFLIAAIGSYHPAQGSEGLPAPKPTVGAFVVGYAEAMKLVPAGATPEVALAALRSARVIDGATFDLASPLTEGDVVALSRSMQFGIATSNPGRAMSQNQVDAFMSVFGPSLATGQVGNPRNGANAAASTSTTANSTSAPPDNRPPNAADPTSKGNGKGTGLSPHFPF